MSSLCFTLINDIDPDSDKDSSLDTSGGKGGTS